MVPDGHAALQGLRSIPHPTSVAAGFYRNAVINGSGTSAGRALLTMSEFAVAPARLIDNGGRRAIGIALRPQHIIGDVLGMNRCHGRRHRATRGGHGGARLSLSSLCRPSRPRPTGCCSCAYISPRQTGPRGKVELSPESAARPLSGPNCRFPPGRRLHAEFHAQSLPILALSSI